MSPQHIGTGSNRVICFEWFGDGPPPAPKWHRNIRAGFSPEEESYITRALREIVGDTPMPATDEPWTVRMTDGELLHSIWGVAL